MTDPTGCTCQANDSFIGCPRHDAAMRSPEQVEAHIAVLQAERAERNSDRRRGWCGGTKDMWDELAEEVGA